MPDVVRDLVVTGCDLVVLGGGDGTVSSVVDVLFYGGGNVAAAGAGIDDRTLDVYAIEHRGRRQLLRLASGVRTGELVRRKDVHHYRTARVLLETDPDLPVNLDGEVEARTPKPFAVDAGALRVVVPAGSTAARYDAGR